MSFTAALIQMRSGRNMARNLDDASEMIRAAASDPAFLAGVLDHVASDEPLLLAVAEHAGVKPEAVMRARAALSGQAWEREVP